MERERLVRDDLGKNVEALMAVTAGGNGKPPLGDEP